MSRSATVPALVAAGMLFIPVAAHAEPDHAGEDLHFSHPLFGESPSPDTKVRVDYFFRNESRTATGESHTVRFQGEYALANGSASRLTCPLRSGIQIMRAASGISILSRSQ